MKTTNYQSVPVIASVIGSKSRKTMFLTAITSLDGKTMFKDDTCPVRWQNFNTKPEWRYTNLRYGLNNILITPGKYYKFDFDESVLMTEQGPVGPHGQSLTVKGLVKKQEKTYDYVAWEEHSQSLVEFPLSKATPAMDIDYTSYRGNLKMISHRLVDGKIQKYLQLLDRYIIYIPLWKYKTMTKRFVAKEITPEFLNDDNQESVIEETSINSFIQQKFDYINRTEMYSYSSVAQTDEERQAIIKFENSQSLEQWEKDNPEYSSL